MDLKSKEAKIGLVIIIVGIVFILNNFEIFNFMGVLWRLWPLLLIWWGYTLLRKRGKRDEGDGNFNLFGDRVETTTAPYVRHSSAFGDIRVKLENREIAGGSISSVFGKVAVDLQSVEAVSGYGQLDLHSVFGDIIIRTPDHLPFEIVGSSPFGSIISPEGEKISGRNYRSPGAENAGEKLVIKASYIFGDIELIK